MGARGDDRRRHERAVIDVPVRILEEGDTHGERPQIWRVDDDDRPEEVIPAARGRESWPRWPDRRLDQRRDDREDDAHLAGPVDPRSLDDVHWDCLIPWRSMKTPKALAKLGARIPRNVSTQPILERRIYRATEVTWTGTIRVPRMRRKKTFCRGKRYTANAYPANRPKRSEQLDRYRRRRRNYSSSRSAMGPWRRPRRNAPGSWVVGIHLGGKERMSGAG